MKKGFTLIEIIVSMAIVTGLIFAISMFGIDIFDFGIFLGQDIVSQQELQLTTRVMVSEIRAATQSVNGSYPIESASENSFVFYSDIDGDGFTERVRYFLQGDTLYKGVIVPTGNPMTYPTENEKVTEQVHNIYSSAGNIFSYFDANYTGTEAELTFPVSIPDIRLLKINLTVDPTPLDTKSRVSFSDQVEIRNL